MEMVRERESIQVENVELEAQQHNAQISERYRRLQDALADQFAPETYASTSTMERTTSAPVQETPVVEQAPVVDNARPTASVFTADKFNSIEMGNATPTFTTAITPTYVAPVVEQAPATAIEVGVQAQYSLSPLAKVVMAAFGVVVIGMMSLIGVNTNLINQKKIKIKNLEKMRNQLVEQHDEIQRRIEAAQSEETIMQWAQEEGLLPSGN